MNTRALALPTIILAFGLWTSGCGGKDKPTPPAVETTAPAPDKDKTPADKATEAKPGEPAATGGETPSPRREIEVDDGKKTAAAEPNRGKAPGDDKESEAVVHPDPPVAPKPGIMEFEELVKNTVGPAVDLGKGPRSAVALTYLPSTTAALFVVRAPRVLHDALGVEAYLKKYADRVADARAEAKRTFNVDPFSLATWEAMGVDMDAPSGIVGIDPIKESGAVFFGVKDGAALQKQLATIVETLKVPLKSEKVGDSTVWSHPDESELALVLRGDTFWLVFQDRRGAAVDTAKLIAAQDPATSFARTVEFAGAVKPLEKADDMVAWVNARAFAVASMSRGEARAMGLFLDGLRGMGFGANISSRSVEASAYLPLADGSLFKRLLKNSATMPTVLAATPEAPLFLAAVTIDMAAYTELIVETMKAQGVPLEELQSQLKGSIGMTYQEAVALYTGEIGITVSGDLDAISRGEDPLESLTGALVVGLAKPDAYKALIAKLSTHPMMKEVPIKIDAETGSMMMPTGMGRPVHIQLAGNNLVMSLDPKVAARFASVDPAKSFAASASPAGLKQLLLAKDRAGVLYMPQTVPGTFMMTIADMGKTDDTHMKPGDDPEQKKIAAELKEIQAKIDALEEEQDAKQLALGKMVFEGLGVTAESIRVTDTGLSFVASQFLNADISEIVLAIAGAVETSGGDDDDDELDELYEKKWELRSKVQMKPPNFDD